MSAVLAVIAAPVSAEEWPSRPLTMVVAFPAGGSDDILARILAPRLSELLGQPVAVENVPGAGGVTGASGVARAPADGYRMMLGTSATHALSQALHEHPPFDASADFTPVGLIAEQPFILIARRDLPADGLASFIAYARAHHVRMRYGSAGAGSATHLVCALFNARVGVTVDHVARNGGAAAMSDLISGQIDYFCPVVTIAIPPIEHGQVKPVAILAQDRAPRLPNVPTAHEQGLTEFSIHTWFAVFLPKGVAAPIVQRLHDALGIAVETSSVQERLKQIGAEAVSPERRTPRYLATFLRAEIQKWTTAIKAGGLKTDCSGCR